MVELYGQAALVILGYVFVAFLFSWAVRDNSWVDVAWGMGFVVLAWVFHSAAPHPSSGLTAALVSAWGIRLSAHIGWRKLLHPGEDWRYARWRQEWGKWVVPRAFLQVFLLQGFLMWIISSLIWQRPGGLVNAWYQWVGIAVWATGFFWEAIGDWQLLRFKADPANKGRIMRYGLWRYSRHPNYFGEILVWWGLFLLVLPWGVWWLALLSPLTITWLLARVSGVPMLEEKYRNNPEYQEYVKRTPGLIPWRRAKGIGL